MSLSYNNISVIIVLYNPTEEQLARHRQFASRYHGVIVDNSIGRSFEEDSIGLMRYVANGRNLGVAEAQNIGLRLSLTDGQTEYVVFLDQDSVIQGDYPLRIVDEYQRLSAGRRLALLGPTVKDIMTAKAYVSAVHRDKVTNDGFIHRREVISSGSVVPASVMQELGFFDSSLFIDYVDFEWCWRAEKKGYECGITNEVEISHHVGLDEINIGRHKVIISAPQRYFYQYRNYLRLCGRAYVPSQWKINYGVKLFLRMIYFPFCVHGWRSIEYNMFKGIYHGMFKG